MMKGKMPPGMPSMRDGTRAGPVLKGPPTRRPGPAVSNILGLPKTATKRKAMPTVARRGRKSKKAY